MKHIFNYANQHPGAATGAALLISAAALTFTVSSCSLFDEEDPEGGADGMYGNYGELSLRFSGDGLSASKGGATASAKLDTNSFILTITDKDGDVMYDGLYGESPEVLSLPAGTYDVKVVSAEFTKPAFEAPQWGDEQYVLVESGKRLCASLNCSQLNSGVRLGIASSFLEDYPDGALLLKGSDGSLIYGYKEKRTAYFNPGKVSLVLTQGSADEVLLERYLEASQILVLQIKTSSSAQGKGGLSIQVDTTRDYLSETFTIGQGSSGTESKGESCENAYTLAEAKAACPQEDVWVGAYIVGGDLTNKSVSFTPPFSSTSNLAIGARSNTGTREKCIAVQLPAGDVRDNLNLVNNPELLGKYVYLKGDLESSYFGLVGLKNVSDYSF